MGIMHHGQIVGMASFGTELCVRACPGFSVGQASRATGEILGPSDATQAGGWHSHLGRRVLSQVPAPLQFEPFSHVGVVSKYLCIAIPKWRSRQLVCTIRSSAFLRAGVVQIQASPKLWTSVLALVMCIFCGGLIGRMLARPAWPWSFFPMPAATCAAGSWFSQRGGTEGRSYYIGLGACSVHFFLYCILLRPVTGLFSPGVTSICCGS
jgi:hypothetical protein